MCVTSAVMDQYRPWFPHQWPHQYPNIPTVPPVPPWRDPNPPQKYPVQPVDKTVIINQPVIIDPDELRELIESFRKAVEAAETFDRLTGQPDCVDPEKAALEERVAELERKLDEIAKVASDEPDHDNE